MRRTWEWPRALAIGCLALLLASCARILPPRRERVVQPVQEYFLDVRGKSPFRAITHMATDCGLKGSNSSAIVWKPGRIDIDLSGGDEDEEWAGMWHSLAGHALEGDRTLDFARCYPPWIRRRFQPRCIGITVRAAGRASLKLQVKTGDGRVLWQATHLLDTGGEMHEMVFPVSPHRLSAAKALSWTAEGEARLSVDSIGLAVEFPPMPFAERAFLISYAKLSRCYSRADGAARDRAHARPGTFDNVPASGMFCLATAAAWRLGIVDRAFAEQTLHAVHATIGTLPRAAGLLPHFIHRPLHPPARQPLRALPGL